MSLSISDFQKISNGTYNAGDITLTSSGKLDKVNNHVGLLKGWNNKSISAATILEVKNAFVQALKNAGVDGAHLAGVREELGLPKDGGTKGLDLTTLKPLSRAQTREILDRFAGVINDKAQRTVVSNRWDALKASNIAGYENHLAIAAAVNQKTAETLAAAQKKLGADVLTNGAGSIPSNIRKSSAYVNLSPAGRDKFAKVFACMLFQGGADVGSIAAKAMKKTLISEYGTLIADEAERDRFKGFVLGCPDTTDLARIEQDVKDAKQAAADGKEPEVTVKFTARDAVPLELQKMSVLENARNIAISKGVEVDDDNAAAMMDQMSKWEDIKPGQMKIFESWAKEDISNYINKSIGGDELGGHKRPLEFDDDGLCTQFRKDSYRSQFTIGRPVEGKPGETGKIEDNAKVYGMSKQENQDCLNHIRKILPDKADRSFISALMNQSTLATIAILNTNSVIDPDDKSENPPTLRGLDPEGARVPNCDLNSETELLAIFQPLSNDGCRYELRVDDKNNTAKLTITANYELRMTMNLSFPDPPPLDKIGNLVSSYEIQITGLGSGNPQIASVGFRQELEAVNMQ